MRTIKFRFWDKDLRKMCYRDPAKMDFSHPNIIPLQYIGLNDSNGKEIFEQDILKSLHFKDGKGKEYYLYHKILWSDKYNAWQAVDIKQEGHEPNGNPMLFVYIKTEWFQVVGNSYENQVL